MARPLLAKIQEGDLQPGQTLPWDVYGAAGSLWLKAGVLIATQAQIDRLIQDGYYPAPDEEEIARRNALLEAQNQSPSVVRQLDSAYRKIEAALGSLAGSPQGFRPLILEAAELVFKSCNQNRDIALAVVLLKHGERYSITHALHTAIVAQIIGTKIGWPDQELRALINAALTMNLGMMNLQDQLQQQSAPLSPEQKLHLQRHPITSVEILQKAGINDEFWLAAVLQHHEVEDGSGYPLGKHSAEILNIARLIHLADLYTARITQRSYREAVHPSVALRDIFQERGKQIAPDLAMHFIKDIGIYPPGTLVKLANGEIAVVSQLTVKTNTPIVHAITGPWGAPINPPIKRDTSQPHYAIREIASPKALAAPVDMQKLWGKEAAPAVDASKAGGMGSKA